MAGWLFYWFNLWLLLVVWCLVILCCLGASSSVWFGGLFVGWGWLFGVLFGGVWLGAFCGVVSGLYLMVWVGIRLWLCFVFWLYADCLLCFLCFFRWLFCAGVCLCCSFDFGLVGVVRLGRFWCFVWGVWVVCTGWLFCGFVYL